jgi:hypothetical protein
MAQAYRLVIGGREGKQSLLPDLFWSFPANKRGKNNAHGATLAKISSEFLIKLRKYVGKTFCVAYTQVGFSG